MHVFALLPVLASVLVASGVSVAAHPSFLEGAAAQTCKKESVVHEEFIGPDKNVKVQYSHCDEGFHVSADGTEHSLSKRQDNVCGAPCNTFCFQGSTGGPSEDDCRIVADALLFESQNTGVFFNATASGTPTDKVTLQFQSCLTFFLNQGPNDLAYCRTEMSKLVTFLAGDCDAANGAHGGLCVAADQRWFVQVQNTSG